MTHEPGRFERDWGTPEEVEAAWRAGWDIDKGPPPFHGLHALPPESTVEGENPSGEKFLHNGIEPTDARPLFVNDTYEEPSR